MSHDRVTRLWQGDGSGQTRLELVLRPRFGSERGARISAATVLPTPCATAMERLAGGVQPGTPAGLWLLPGLPGVDQGDAPHAAGPARVAAGRSLEVRLGARVAQRRPPSLALSAGGGALRRLVSLHSFAEADSRRWGGLCGPAEAAAPGHWTRGAARSAPSLLDRPRVVARRPHRAHGQTRPAGPMPPIASRCWPRRCAGGLVSARRARP